MLVTGLLIAAIVAGVLACPLMMWLGRRGIGPGCGVAASRRREDEETLESLRSRQEELGARIAQLEADRESPSLTSSRRG